jgi:hypothetical protein
MNMIRRRILRGGGDKGASYSLACRAPAYTTAGTPIDDRGGHVARGLGVDNKRRARVSSQPRNELGEGEGGGARDTLAHSNARIGGCAVGRCSNKWLLADVIPSCE